MNFLHESPKQWFYNERFYNERFFIETVILWAIHASLYIILSFLFCLVDIYYYKDKRYQNVTWYDLICVGENILLTLPYILCYVPFYRIRGMYTDEVEYYYLVTIMRLGLTILAEDILFYTFHRILHMKPFYSLIHKKHHKYQQPVAFTAVYCTQIEHIIANVTPVLVAPLITGLPWPWVKLWIVMVTVNTLMSHSGYWFGEFHDIHHEKFTWNYGVFGLMDQAFSTYHYPRQNIVEKNV